MSLYVTRPADPAPGVDWRTVVPGQWLYNIVSVSARLTRHDSGAILQDASPNNNDGTYSRTATVADEVTGALTGDPGLAIGRYPAAATIGVDLNTAIDATADFSLNWWMKRDPSAPTPFFDFQGFTALNAPNISCAINGAERLAFFVNGGGAQAQSVVVPALVDLAWHMVTFAYHVGTGVVDLYADGVALAKAIDIPGTPPATSPARITFGMNVIHAPQGSEFTDEFAAFNYALAAVDVGALYAAAPDFSLYTATCLALTPIEYYHYDDTSPQGPGRQVTLQITDGTHTVDQFCTGFPIATVGNAFDYTWQVGVPNNTRTPDQSAITVGLPPLVLPAGYTLGANTLDLGSLDQWSNIAIWWDSDVMDAQRPIEPYAYPPGALLALRSQMEGT